MRLRGRLVKSRFYLRGCADTLLLLSLSQVIEHSLYKKQDEMGKRAQREYL